MKMKVSEIRIVIRDYEKMTAKQISKRTGVKPKTIHECARRLNLVKTPNWTEKEFNFLIIVGAKIASNFLDRSFNSCKIKYSRWINTKLIN